jgi:hypothetical protein
MGDISGSHLYEGIWLFLNGRAHKMVELNEEFNYMSTFLHSLTDSQQ